MDFDTLTNSLPEAEDPHISRLVKHVLENEAAEMKYGTKISFVMITARTDYPYSGRPDLKIFEPTIESFKVQTMKDFELIIVDHLYDQRKDYFKDRNLPFHVKHVPAAPNIWHDAGLPGICTQYNKGIIYADGELIYFMGEGYLFIPEFCENLWKHYKEEGYIPFVWYFYDNTYIPDGHVPVNEASVFDHIHYNILGYTGQNISHEHRSLVAFKENDTEIYHAPWEWWFGCSSTPLYAMLKINGFNQRCDGDRMLLDCDVGSRLQLAGFEKFALFRDLFVIRIWSYMHQWNPRLPKDAPTIKCNLPIIHWSRYRNHYRANDHILADEDIKWIKEEYCAKQCAIRELCKTQHPWQYPFEHKGGYTRFGFKCEKKWFDFWMAHQENINLAEEREKRIAGDEKYKEGTFTNLRGV